LLLRGHQELNSLVETAVEIGMESKDIYELISLMRQLGGSGFRNLMHHGAVHSSEFRQEGRSQLSQEVPPSPINQMAFSELANPRLVFKRLEFTEKSELLHYMLEKIGAVFSSLDLEHVYKKLMSNEEDVSSGLGNGVAVPHLFVDELDQTIIAVARIPGGIDFRAIDRKPVYLVCLILSDPNSYQNHLNLLAYLARKFQISSFTDEILRAGSKKSILSMFGDVARPKNRILGSLDKKRK